MRSLLELSTAFVFLGGVTADEGELIKRDNVTLKAPVVVVPSQHWEGVDGTWSTFELRVGTPAQDVRVLPATSWQETWVVYGAAANACNASLGIPSNCNEARGRFFDSAMSSSWEAGPQLYLGLNAQLGYEGLGQYGFDTVGFGFMNDTGPTLKHQIVSEMISDTWFLGMLGLGFQPTNFSNYANPQPSFADTLWSNGNISSMSWSYTAGAYYRLKGVLGSLIFGGYDASRFTPNDVIFTMTSDNLRDIVVTIRSITSTTASGNMTLMSTPELVYIDSSVPELWLPTEVCQQFEKAFGLKWDNSSGLYLVNSTTHGNLLRLNPNITVTLANQKSGGPTIDIVLPYASFNLNVTSPILLNRTSQYFPLKQASNSNLYTLGRAFLQEAYVTAHYNSRTFNVSQCVFDDSLSPHVLALPSTLPTSTSSSPTNDTKSSFKAYHKTLLGGAIAGIIIGILAFLALIILAIFLIHKCRNCPEKRPSTPIAEIDTDKRIEPCKGSSAYTAQQGSGLTNEVSSQDAKVEIKGDPIMHPQELAAEVPSTPTTLVVNDNRRHSGNGGRNLSPLKETRAPLTELNLGERRLRESWTGGQVDEGHAMCMNTDMLPSMMERERGGNSVDSRVYNPISKGGRTSWGPATTTTSLGRRQSRFEERWSSERERE
ncbi:aspartic peptidase domain-containing protein [Tricladium varicosporioides]|nr:aspartic peptidase domain-containing protein [Hymenoscyphus varicosporioides]